MKKTQQILLNSLRKKNAFSYIQKPKNYIGRKHITNHDDQELPSYYEYIYEEDFPKSVYGRGNNTDGINRFFNSSFYQWDMWTPSYPGEVWDRMSLVCLAIIVSAIAYLMKELYRMNYEDLNFNKKKHMYQYCQYSYEPTSIAYISE